jgi:hypothetical protein
MVSKKERTILANRHAPATIYRSKIASFEFSGILRAIDLPNNAHDLLLPTDTSRPAP